MIDTATIFAIVSTFLLAGTVKGVIGVGQQTVVLALLTVAIDLPSAMALLILPSFVTNVWQAIAGGNGRAILLRLWPFLLMATVTIWIGAMALTRVDLKFLTALLGAILVAYSVVNLVGLRFTIRPNHEVWVGPLSGSINGVLTGMTGSFVVPGVMYLHAIGLSRDQLIQAMGMLFLSSTLALAVALQQNNLFTIEHGKLSLVALLPAIVGMVFGQLVRKKLSEKLFRKIFFISLLILGSYIVAREFGILS